MLAITEDNEIKKKEEKEKKTDDLIQSAPKRGMQVNHELIIEIKMGNGDDDPKKNKHEKEKKE